MTWRLYDSNILLSQLMGKNKDYLTGRIPHIARLLKKEVQQVMDHADVVVIGNKAPEFREAVADARPDQMIIDLVRIDKEKVTQDNYVGICW